MNELKPEDVMPEGAVIDALVLRAPHDAVCRHALEIIRAYRKENGAMQEVVDNAIDCSNRLSGIIEEKDAELKDLWEERNRIYAELQEWKAECKKYQDAWKEKDAEIERLNKELDSHFEKWKILAEKTEQHYAELYQEAKQVVRAEAITEFEERLRAELLEKDFYPVIVKNAIEKIAKEMKGEKK